MALSQVADNPNEKQLKDVENELFSLLEDEFPFVEEFLSMHGGTFDLPTSVEDLHGARGRQERTVRSHRDELFRAANLKPSPNRF